MFSFVLSVYAALLLLCHHPNCQAAVSEQNFSSEDCTTIAVGDVCNCTYNDKYDSATIVCGNTTVGGDAQLKIAIYEESDVDIFCSPTIAPTVALLARLPILGGMHKCAFLGVHHCLPFTDLLTRLALTRFNILHIHGLGAFSYLSTQDFGRNLSYLQTVGDLELLAQPHVGESAIAQRLDAELFTSFDTLFSLKIDLNITQLPVGIFAPLAGTLTDLVLYGHLRQFPRVELAPLQRLRTLTLMRHEFTERLRAVDFVELGLLEQLTLHNCGITLLPAHIFTPLAALRSLKLSGNELSTLPDSLFVGQPQMKALDLSGNRLTSLPRALFHPSTKLTYLELSRNRFLHLNAHNLPPLSTLLQLSMSNNELRVIEANTFEAAERLQLLSLNHNRLNWKGAEACAVLNGLRSLETLTLQNNMLMYLCDSLGAHNHTTQNLRLLDVRYNRLTRLNARQLNALNNSASLSELYLSHNPWNCDCDAQLLHTFVKHNRLRFRNLIELRCANTLPAPLVELTYRDFCLPDLGINVSYVLVFACLSTLSLIVLLTALLYYKYKLTIQVWLYAHHLCLCCISELELDRERKYDAFISYAHQDEQFVERELLPGLECGSPAFKVCIHVRDWLAGAFIAEQIIDSVEQSRRTIIVLSQNFIASNWARMEFRMAHQCALNEGRTRIILIIYGDLMDTERMDQELCAYLKMNTYLKWGEPWFWEKLRYAMPHTRRGWESGLFTKNKHTDEIPLQTHMQSG